MIPKTYKHLSIHERDLIAVFKSQGKSLRGIAHSFEPGGLILRKVRIGRDAVIGLNAIVLPGVEVGERAVVGAGVFVPKDTKIPAGSVYLGKKE